MAIEQLLPADAVRPRWSSGSALVYIGAIVALFATSSLLGILSEDHGDAALVGYSGLAMAAALGLALALQRSGRTVAAGVLAALTVVFFAVFAGALETLIGVLDDFGSNDWTFGRFLLELLTIGAAFVALRRFRAPLLMLPIALGFWFVLVDFGAEEVMSIVAGLVLVAAGHAVDRAAREPFGFWLHVVGGLAFGGGVLALVDGTAGWILVAVLSIAYILSGAYTFGRSSYAVLGAVGILATTTHFIQDGLAFVGVFVPVEIGDPSGGIDPWQIALWYVGAGLLILGLGLLGDRIARVPGATEA